MKSGRTVRLLELHTQRLDAVAERRLSIARRLFNALVAALDRVITLRDGQGREIASSKPDPDAEDPTLT
jgi:hypothetical protein